MKLVSYLWRQNGDNFLKLKHHQRRLKKLRASKRLKRTNDRLHFYYISKRICFKQHPLHMHLLLDLCFHHHNIPQKWRKRPIKRWYMQGMLIKANSLTCPSLGCRSFARHTCSSINHCSTWSLTPGYFEGLKFSQVGIRLGFYKTCRV